jgi:GST-like protein
MAGQNHHFSSYAPEKLPYAIERYVRETNRLYGVLDRRLREHPFVAGEAYSIADLAIYPWIVPWERQQQKLSDTPHLERWFQQVAARPATVRAYARGSAYSSAAPTSEQARKVLFGQTAESVRIAAEEREPGETRK